MKNGNLINRLRRFFKKLRLRPIRVVCFHQTSMILDESVYAQPDWMPLNELRNKLISYQKQGYKFITLQEAYKHISKDWVRSQKYIVLTADDGLKCQLELLPWLQENKIPITIFFNVANLDGNTCGEQIIEYFGITNKEKEMILAKKLYANFGDLHNVKSDIFSIGLHGYIHSDVTKMTDAEFQENVEQCVQIFSQFCNYIPFFAYPYGACTKTTDQILLKKHIIPVYIDGLDNYNDKLCIHRKML